VCRLADSYDVRLGSSAGVDTCTGVARSRHVPSPLDYKPQNSNDPPRQTHMINF
jgi:hypothetical protein